MKLIFYSKYFSTINNLNNIKNILKQPNEVHDNLNYNNLEFEYLLLNNLITETPLYRSVIKKNNLIIKNSSRIKKINKLLIQYHENYNNNKLLGIIFLYKKLTKECYSYFFNKYFEINIENNINFLLIFEKCIIINRNIYFCDYFKFYFIIDIFNSIIKNILDNSKNWNDEQFKLFFKLIFNLSHKIILIDQIDKLDENKIYLANYLTFYVDDFKDKLIEYITNKLDKLKYNNKEIIIFFKNILLFFILNYNKNFNLLTNYFNFSGKYQTQFKESFIKSYMYILNFNYKLLISKPLIIKPNKTTLGDYNSKILFIFKNIYKYFDYNIIFKWANINRYFQLYYKNKIEYIILKKFNINKNIMNLILYNLSKKINDYNPHITPNFTDKEKKLLNLDINRTNIINKKYIPNFKNLIYEFSYSLKDFGGYYQGLNFIISYIFHISNYNKDNTLKILNYIKHRILIHYFNNNICINIELINYLIDKFVKKLFKKLYKLWDREGIYSFLYSSPFIISLFTIINENNTDNSIKDQCFELIISDGLKGIIKTICTFIKINKEYFLNLNYENTFLYFNNVLKKNKFSENSLFMDDFKEKYNRINITNKEIEYYKNKFFKINTLIEKIKLKDNI